MNKVLMSIFWSKDIFLVLALKLLDVVLVIDEDLVRVVSIWIGQEVLIGCQAYRVKTKLGPLVLHPAGKVAEEDIVCYGVWYD